MRNFDRPRAGRLASIPSFAAKAACVQGTRADLSASQRVARLWVFLCAHWAVGVPRRVCGVGSCAGSLFPLRAGRFP